MKTVLTLAAAAAVAGLAAFAPAQAAPLTQPVSWNWPLPEFSEAATFRHDHAGHAAHHYPSCTGLTSGTAHHSCGSLTGGPAGGLN